MKFEEKLQKQKEQIYENISLSKERGMNRLSAILAIQDENKQDLENGLIQELKNNGYKVTTTEGELKVLTIEW